MYLHYNMLKCDLFILPFIYHHSFIIISIIIITSFSFFALFECFGLCLGIFQESFVLVRFYKVFEDSHFPLLKGFMHAFYFRRRGDGIAWRGTEGKKGRTRMAAEQRIHQCVLRSDIHSDSISRSFPIRHPYRTCSFIVIMG